jgi:undecaprenyl phosphate-alpha-L-ara4N flippase subunit ArnF
MMPGKLILLILVAVGFSAAGQLLLKAGAEQLATLTRLNFLLASARNARVLLGLGAWAASTVSWLYVLRVAPLSRAYALTSLTYVVIFVAGVYLFNEEVRRVHLVGTLFIMVGIACLLSGE